MGLDRARRAALNQMLDDRRLELGLRWRDVARLAGTSTESIRAIRHGDAGTRELALTDIETTLQLRHGCLRAYLCGESHALPPSSCAAPLPGERTAIWVANAMSLLGVPSHRIEAFAARMNWTTSAAPAPDDLTIAQLHAVAQEAGMSLQAALEALWSFLSSGPGSAGARPVAGRSPLLGRRHAVMPSSLRLRKRSATGGQVYLTVTTLTSGRRK